MVDPSKAAKLTARLYETLEEKRLGPHHGPKCSATVAETAQPAAKRPAAAADQSAQSAQNGVKKMRWDQPATPAVASAPVAATAPAAEAAKAPLTPQQVGFYLITVCSLHLVDHSAKCTPAAFFVLLGPLLLVLSDNALANVATSSVKMFVEDMVVL